jgi:glutamyl-Q tRNA(Asp) synthetase
MAQPVFRFAPSPNGLLHLGHARSALLNAALAERTGGRFLLRIEDIDPARSSDASIAAVLEDLTWLGLRWEEVVLRQSARMGAYAAAAEVLNKQGLLFPCNCSRAEIQAAAKGHDPDGAALYPGNCRHGMRPAGPYAVRVAMDRAAAMVGQLSWQEQDASGSLRSVPADPSRWGDAVIQRKEVPTSYHLAVVVDDAAQGITHVVRGMDLFEATAVHRLLQSLLGLPQPVYRHHGLVMGRDGQKLSKSLNALSLRAMRMEGATPADIRRLSRYEEDLS